MANNKIDGRVIDLNHPPKDISQEALKELWGEHEESAEDFNKRMKELDAEVWKKIKNRKSKYE